MISILATFCCLALSYVHCGPAVANQSNNKEVNEWLLSEVWISAGFQQRPTEHYTRKVVLSRFENTFALDAAKNDDEEATNILHFEIEELYALLGGTVYITTRNSNLVIRMVLTKESEAQYFKRFLEPTKKNQMFMVLHNYRIDKIIESDEDLIIKREVVAVDERMPIYLTVYAELDKQGTDTTKRRIIIRGGRADELFAVFNRDECDIIRLRNTDRFVLQVEPRGSFNAMYYAVRLNGRNNTPTNFEDEMISYTSRKIVAPEDLVLLAKKL